MSDDTCSVEWCNKLSRTRGWCAMHYWRFLHSKDMDARPHPGAPVKPRLCNLEGCERQHLAKGYCSLHYDRVKRLGVPGAVDPLPLHKPSRFQPMASTDAAWVAGFLEGEGSFMVLADGDRRRARCSAAGTDEDTMQRLRDITRVGSLRGPFQNGKRGKKPVWIWQVTRMGELADLLPVIRPYMSARRTAAIDDVLALISR